MLAEITIPINDDLTGLSACSIIVGHSGVTDNYYLVIDIVLNVKFNIYIKNGHGLSVGTSNILSQRISFPIHSILQITGFVEENPLLFKSAFKELGGGY